MGRENPWTLFSGWKTLTYSRRLRNSNPRPPSNSVLVIAPRLAHRLNHSATEHFFCFCFYRAKHAEAARAWKDTNFKDWNSLSSQKLDRQKMFASIGTYRSKPECSSVYSEYWCNIIRWFTLQHGQSCQSKNCNYCHTSVTLVENKSILWFSNHANVTSCERTYMRLCSQQAQTIVILPF